MAFGIVYGIWNKANGKVYIGQTIKTAKRRWIEHVASARRGDGFALHRAIAKYGPESFSIEVICVAGSQEELNSLEVAVIREFKSNHSSRGYNATPGGEFGKLTGEAEERRLAGLRSPELREKRRKQYTGKGNPFFGKTHDEDTMILIRAGAGRGGKAWLGRKRSEKNRKLISDSWSAKFPTDRAVEMYRSGFRVDEIAPLIGFTVATVYRRLHASGEMEPRKKGPKHRANRGN